MAAALSTISISACPTLQSSCCYYHLENSNEIVSSKSVLPSGVVVAGLVSLPFFFLKKRNPSHSVEKRGRYHCQFAKRKSSQVAVSEGEELDEDLRAGLNETSNEALKVMLSEDDKLVAAFKEKVDYLGEFLVQDGQHEAAQFMLVLRGMLDHELYPQKDDLRGLYKKAFDKIWGVLEDSGWLLTQPGAEAGEVQMVDDELIPPVLQIKY